MAGDLVVRRDGSVVFATINRPEKLNALNKEVYEDLRRLVDVLQTDKTARALFITGTGDKAFCVGADLKERQGMNEKDVLLRLQFVRELYLALENLPLPVVALMNGMALGGGFELALACDLRLAVDTATLGLPEVELAIIPGTGGTQRLSRLVGPSKALELILLARRITSSEAFQLGLVNKVVSPQALSGEATLWAQKILESGPIAIRQAKRAVRLGFERKMEEATSVEIECYRACLSSKDRLEGLKAFSEKRRPVYVGE